MAEPADPEDSTARATRVLVVDDHDVLASSLAMVLDAEPDLVSAGVAGSLRQARELIRTSAPDVLLLDHRLPDGDGVGAIGELRALRPSMRVVVLTASAADHVLIAAIEAGASGFVSKTRGIEEVTAAAVSAGLVTGARVPEHAASTRT